MSVKTWAVTAGLGVAAGAVGILMLSRSNPTRKLAASAAEKVETAAWKLSDQMSRRFDL